MSNLQKQSNSDLNNEDLLIEEISTSKGLFNNSFKRLNTKTWYKQANKEDIKNPEKSIFEIKFNNIFFKI